MVMKSTTLAATPLGIIRMIEAAKLATEKGDIILKPTEAARAPVVIQAFIDSLKSLDPSFLSLTNRSMCKHIASSIDAYVNTLGHKAKFEVLKKAAATQYSKPQESSQWSRNVEGVSDEVIKTIFVEELGGIDKPDLKFFLPLAMASTCCHLINQAVMDLEFKRSQRATPQKQPAEMSKREPVKRKAAKHPKSKTISAEKIFEELYKVRNNLSHLDLQEDRGIKVDYDLIEKNFKSFYKTRDHEYLRIARSALREFMQKQKDITDPTILKFFAAGTREMFAEQITGTSKDSKRLDGLFSGTVEEKYKQSEHKASGLSAKIIKAYAALAFIHEATNLLLEAKIAPAEMRKTSRA